MGGGWANSRHNVTGILQLDLHRRVPREIIRRNSSNDFSTLARQVLVYNKTLSLLPRRSVTQCRQKHGEEKNNLLFSLTGTFGQSESWSVPVPSSWQHPAVPCEDTNDLSCSRRGETPSLNANLPNGGAAGDTVPSAGEVKVGGVTSQMIHWVCAFLFVCGLKVLACFSSGGIAGSNGRTSFGV